MCEAERDFKELLVGAIQTILMGIEMGGANTHGVGAIDLRAKLDFRLARIDAGFGRPVVMEVAVLVDEAGDFVGGGDWSPAVVNPLAGKGEVEAEVEVGMGFGIVGNFWEPWAGHHDAGGIDRSGFQGFNGG